MKGKIATPSNGVSHDTHRYPTGYPQTTQIERVGDGH